MGAKPKPTSPLFNSASYSATLYLALLACFLGPAAPSSNPQTATSCEVLKRLLADEHGPVDIRVEGSLRCNRTFWGESVEVNRNVTVRGASGGVLPGIDWSDARKAVVAGRGIFMTFRQLVLVQDEMGINGIDLSFFTCEGESHGTFSEVVVGVRSCPGSVEYFSEVVRRIERPPDLSGQQQVTVRGPNSIMVDDVGVQMHPTMAVWRLCSVAFQCGVGNLRDVGLEELFDSRMACGGDRLWHGVDVEGASRKQLGDIGVLLLGSTAGVVLLAMIGLGVVSLIWGWRWRWAGGEIESGGSAWHQTELVDRMGRGS